MIPSKTFGAAAVLMAGLYMASAATNAHAAKVASAAISSSVTVSLTIAEPCLNSRNLHLLYCRGRQVPAVVKESYEEVKMFSKDYEVMQGYDQTYLIRTFDY